MVRGPPRTVAIIGLNETTEEPTLSHVLASFCFLVLHVIVLDMHSTSGYNSRFRSETLVSPDLFAPI
jgi:hypothetical protein